MGNCFLTLLGLICYPLICVIFNAFGIEVNQLEMVGRFVFYFKCNMDWPLIDTSTNSMIWQLKLVVESYRRSVTRCKLWFSNSAWPHLPTCLILNAMWNRIEPFWNGWWLCFLNDWSLIDTSSTNLVLWQLNLVVEPYRCSR